MLTGYELVANEANSGVPADYAAQLQDCLDDYERLSAHLGLQLPLLRQDRDLHWELSSRRKEASGCFTNVVADFKHSVTADTVASVGARRR